MPKSSFRGADGFKARLRRVADAADFEMAEANRENALSLQRHVVPRIAVDTGATRDAFADPSAVGISRDPRLKGGWRFGLISKELKKRGWKAHFIEFGTKGYKAGDTRSYQQFSAEGEQRIGKNGKPVGRPRKGLVTRKREVTRNVPARAAKPFFRPGIEAARAEMIMRWKGALARAVDVRGEPISTTNNGV